MTLQASSAEERTVLMLAELDPEIVVTDPDITTTYSRDESRNTDSAVPVAVLLPRSTAEVSACLRAADEHGVRVIVRGAGSGLSGGANADPDSVVLSTRRLNAIIEVDADERFIVVQPGVVTADVRAKAVEHGLFYPPDPGSVDFCSIGGNVATNAGGMCCVKYGVTADFVMQVEAVLADGTILRTGTRTVKGVVGYDLRHLLTGSEGTLAVITEVTLRLVPLPDPPVTMVATFDSLEAAGQVVQEVARRQIAVSMLELLDATTIKAVDDVTHMGLQDVAAMLLMQVDDSAAGEALSGLCEEHATDVALTDDADEGRMLVEARRQALPALERLGDWILDDVSVPRRSIVELIRGIEFIAQQEEVVIGVFGHAGDGNMHPTIIYDASDPASVDRSVRAFDAITALALALGGTVTGEHGTGRLKAPWARRELGAGSRRVHVAIKQALDPRGTLGSPATLIS